jgi:hypothetical protein
VFSIVYDQAHAIYDQAHGSYGTTLFRKLLTDSHLPHCHTWRIAPFGMVMVFMVLELWI